MYSPDCDLRDALLDAVGGGSDRLAVQAGLLREHRGQRAEVAGHQGGLDLESIAGFEKKKFFFSQEMRPSQILQHFAQSRSNW